MKILIWNGSAWIGHRIDAHSFWLKRVPLRRLANRRAPLCWLAAPAPARNVTLGPKTETRTVVHT